MLFFRTSPSALAFAGFACLATLTSFTPNAAAQVAQVCFTDSVPMTPTNWSDQVTFSKFDPALGTLQSIDITFTGSIVGSAQTESLDTGPTTVTLTFEGQIVLTRPDMSQLAAALPQAQFVDTFTGFDGSVDFGGTSGATHSGVMATQTVSATSPPPASDLAAFTGPIGNPGTISLPVMAFGTSVSTGSGNIVSQFTQNASADVQVCYTYLPNTPPTFTCPAIQMASVGVPFSIQICVSDADPGDVVTLSSGPLPAGATLTPPLPIMGNPACTTFDWTPANNQIGSFSVTFTAVDTHQRTSSCTLTIIVAECHTAFGAAPGSSQVMMFGHLYDMQLAGVRRSWPVTMVDMPSFSLGQLPPQFSVQVVMYNPLVFPANQSQWSQVLTFYNTGTQITSSLSGTLNGIHISLETFTTPGGQLRVRFPFTIDGM
jgi:hypothetical protein